MVSLLVRPWALSIDHGPPVVTAARVAAGVALGLGLIVAALVCRRRAPLFAFVVLWSVIALAPTNSVIAKLDPVTEKPLYLVGFAISLGVTGAAREVWTRWPRLRVAGGLTLAALIVAAGVFAHERAELWCDPVALWADAVDKCPACSRAWNNLGMARYQAGQADRALDAFRTALRLDPANATAAYNVGMLSQR